jgi:tRNA (adenine37-N6)-methyltransferase
MQLEEIGRIQSCFEEKFGAPRQPGLCPSAWGKIIFHEKFSNLESLRELTSFSHIWVIFSFHQTINQGWNPTVRPPRLGGNERVGVFASRSTFRPNSLGLSLCKLEGIEIDPQYGPVLLLGGIDIVNDTPIYDIKPYLSYAESIPNAKSGYAEGDTKRKKVIIHPTAKESFEQLPDRSQRVIMEALSLDPRPATQHDEERIYGINMCGVNVRFTVNDKIDVLEIL